MDFLNVEQTFESKLKSVSELIVDFEENFFKLGVLFKEIKGTKLFKKKGYKTFKDFVEKEYYVTGNFASKLINFYKIFVEELDLMEEKILDIGYDRLNLIAPVIKKLDDYEEKIQWVRDAYENDIIDLKENVKEFKRLSKENEKTLKDVYVDQYIQKMTDYLGCNKKSLDFYLALYFQDKDLGEFKNQIKILERKLEEEIIKSK